MKQKGFANIFELVQLIIVVGFGIWLQQNFPLVPWWISLLIFIAGLCCAILALYIVGYVIEFILKRI